jgi:membrane protease YdiL (CAAX protease family)
VTSSTASLLRYRRADTTAIATLVVGAVLLWGTFHAAKGGAAFWIVGFLLAAVWVIGALSTATGAWGDLDVPTLAAATAAGLATFAVFYVAYRVLREIPVLSGALHGVVGTADAGHVVPVLALAIVNAIAEELFFRGALFSLVASRSGAREAAIWTTVIYALVTAASFNVALVIAAVVMGGVFALLRWWSRGMVAPAVAHVVWSTGMLLALHR